MFFFDVKDFDFCAEGGEEVEECGAGGVEAEVIDDERGAGEDGGGGEEKCCGGDVAGDFRFDGVELLGAGDGDGVTLAGELGTEGAEGEFGVVAGAEVFRDGCFALGLKAGEEYAGFDLRAGDGGCELD